MRKFLRSKLLLFLLFSTILSPLFAQEEPTAPVQKLSGTLSSATNGQPLESVVVLLIQDLDTTSTITDSLGRYTFETVAVGRVNLAFQLLGYQPEVVNGVLIEAGREAIVDFALYEQTEELQAIVLEACDIILPDYPILYVNPEEVRRYPANFFDPGRFATQYPGLTIANDQGNAISVRGTSPAFFRWRLEGIEIVNPNHTANAGTFGDRATVGAGGINMLSNEAMSAAQAYRASDLPMHFDNTVSGMLDMRYRKGYPHGRQSMVSAGLLGLEVSTEGPLSRESGASYLVHYRYSFTGLLNALGIDFGEEDIRFQDLSFNLHLPSKKMGTFGLFGIGGTSSNLYESEAPLESVEVEKELQLIDFSSRTGILGLKHIISFGGNTTWNTRVGFSATGTYRDATDRLVDAPLSINDSDSLEQQVLFANSFLQWTTEGYDVLTLGVNYMQRYSMISSSFERGLDTVKTYGVRSGLDQTLSVIRAYGSWKKYLGQWEFNLGLNANWYDENNEFHPGLRVYGQYTLPGAKHRWKAGYQSLSQLPPAVASSVFVGSEDEEPAVFPLMKTEGLFVDYFLHLSNQARFYAGVYHNIYYNMPQSLDPGFGFSAFNQLEQWQIYNTDIGSEGEGRTYGLEVSLHKSLDASWYYILSGSLYRSLYVNATGRELPSQFDRKFYFSGTVGREWTIRSIAEKQTDLGFSFRTVVAGGLQVAPILEDESAELGFTVFDHIDGYTEQLPIFYRLDLQLYLVWEKAGFSQRLSIDIHNLTNRQNTAFYYYDNVAGEVREQFQLGLVPVITYRFYF